MGRWGDGGMGRWGDGEMGRSPRPPFPDRPASEKVSEIDLVESTPRPFGSVRYTEPWLTPVPVYRTKRPLRVRP